MSHLEMKFQRERRYIKQFEKIILFLAGNYLVDCSLREGF